MTALTSAVEVCELWRARCLAALEACGTAPITMTYTAAGIITWDDCCGLLVAAPERVYRTVDFPVEGQSNDPCETGELAVDVIVVLMRCVPSVDDRGLAPKTPDLAAAYKAVIDDAATIWNAVTGPLPDGWQRASVAQQFVGDNGGCVGVETRFTIGLDQEGWCPCE